MKYLAFDGKVFDNELLCREYESGNEQERVNKLCNELFDDQYEPDHCIFRIYDCG